MNPSSAPPTPVDVTDRLLHLLQKALGHELPNQLIAIQGLARLLDLEERDRLSEDGRNYLERLVAAAQRTHELVRSLAEVVRACRLGPPSQPVALEQGLREATAELGLVPPAIDVQLPADGPMLPVPGPALRQLLVELLRNARQAAAPGRPLRIEVGALPGGDRVTFWVRDNGRGVAPDKLPKLFEPFAVREGSRAGVGLLLVRQIVDHHGGTIEVESIPGEGSRFTISFPRLPWA